MSTITLFDNEYLTMRFYTDTKIIHHHFYPGLNSHFLRTGLDRGVELLERYKATKWLSDNREVEPHSLEDGEWINNDWLPRAVKAGWKYWGLVVPNGIAAKMNMDEFVNAFYEQGLWVAVFTNVDEAMQWLETR